MAKFKCKSSGNVFEFFLDHDIESMRKHPEYEEVVEVKETPKQPKKQKQVEE